MTRFSRLGQGASAIAVFAIGAAVLLAGCGSSSGTTSVFPSNGVVATPTPSPSPTATRYYASTFALGDSGTATVNLTALAGGSASGTISVDNGRAAKSRLVVGTGNLSGTINFSTGAVAITGSITQNGVTTPVSVTGNAPGASGTGGTSTLTLGTTNYTAQWVVSTNGPISSNGNNGGNASGGASALAFSASSSNITTGNLNAAVGTAIKQTLPYVGDILTISAADVVNGTPRAVSVIFTGITPAVGTAYDLSGGDVSAGYTEGSGSTKVFEATSGTVTVVSISGKTYNLLLTGVRVTAQTGNPINTGTGSFTIDGTITATLP